MKTKQHRGKYDLNPKHYQLFRYPGGKARLAANPAFRALIDPLVAKADTFYEGFAGSAAISLDIALRYPNMFLAISEMDSSIAAFWKIVQSNDEQEVNDFLWLLSKQPTVRRFRKLKKEPPQTLAEMAYRAVFFNRTSFSGIIMTQPIGGYGQRSEWKIDCRYNVETLEKKFYRLRSLLKGRMSVNYGNSLDWLEQTVPSGELVYLDPPYYGKGDILYPVRMNEFDHGRLRDILISRTNWILSYDTHEKITDLYQGQAQLLPLEFRYSIRGAKETWERANEYLIVSNDIDTSRLRKNCT